MRVWAGFVMTVAAVALALLLAPLATAAGESEGEGERGGSGGAGGERVAAAAAGAPIRDAAGRAGDRPAAAPAPGGDDQRTGDRHVLRWSPRPAVPGPVGELRAWPPEPERFARVRGGEVLPVLPLGAGLMCLGLGLGALGLRLRQC